MDLHHIKKMTDAPDFKTDDILEALADIGFAPCLIYDDNGQWALACEGMQTIRADAKDDLDAYVLVRAEYFKDTIREAVKYWIEQQVREKEQEDSVSKKNCSVCGEPIGWLRRTYCDDCGKVICTDHAHRIENPLGMIATLVCPHCWKKRNSSRRRKDNQ